MAIKGKDKKCGSAVSFGESVSDKIRKRAQELFEKRGNRPGDALTDWLEAEKQIKAELRK
ncbi:MAG TPA: DUF2934 domain-containing protein [Candidatus Omnitrophota bacterium]|nr:DUF2934 domain-containing protein [Candidatus Omnitrophota bacterium]HPT39362.1 DUF2934 domain-containing protein [Candidatus Omnitrophota bacterium]